MSYILTVLTNVFTLGHLNRTLSDNEVNELTAIHKITMRLITTSAVVLLESFIPIPVPRSFAESLSELAVSSKCSPLIVFFIFAKKVQGVRFGRFTTALFPLKTQ